MTCGMASHNRLIVRELELEISVHWRLLNRWRKQRRSRDYRTSMDTVNETRGALLMLLGIRKAGRA